MQNGSGQSVPPTASDHKAPPPKTRLYWSSLTNNEKSVLDAMYEHCRDGSTVWVSLLRLARYCKLSRKTVQRVLHGDPRNGSRSLLKRGIVTLLAPANRGKRRPATYRINADALTEDPEMAKYKKRQFTLPGIKRTAIPGEAVESAATDPRSIVPGIDYGPTVQGTTDPRSTNSLEPDPLSKPLTQHADGALKDLPAWLAIKEMLRGELTPEEWDLWVRPARLLRTMGGNTLQIGLPRSGAIQTAAVRRKQLLSEIAARAGLRAVLTPYPDDWQLKQLQDRFGIASVRKLKSSKADPESTPTATTTFKPNRTPAPMIDAQPDNRREMLRQQAEICRSRQKQEA